MRALKFSLLLVSILTLARADSVGSILVISNSTHKITLTKEQLKNVYLGFQRCVGDWRISPVDQKESSAIRDAFYERVAGKYPLQMKIFQCEQIFSGNARAIPVQTDDQAVIRHIINDPNAIGYVNAATDTSGVNVLLRIE